MRADVLLGEIKAGIEAIKAEHPEGPLPRGQVDAVISFAELALTESTSYDELKARLSELEDRSEQRVHEWRLESFRATLSAGAATLRAAMLITGGGAAALLAFLQALVQGGSPHVGAIAFSLWIMVGAMLSAGLATGATYAGQWCYSEEGVWRDRVGTSFHVIAVVLFLASLAGFGSAAWHAYRPFATP